MQYNTDSGQNLFSFTFTKNFFVHSWCW